MNNSNSTSIKFIHPDGNSHLESIKTDTAEYYLSLFSNDLLLICKPFENTVFTYPIENTMILARIADLGIYVEYNNGRIHWDEYNLMMEDYDDGPVPEPVVFSHNLGYNGGEIECPVCYEDFRDTGGHIALCGHGACIKCLKQMVKANLKTCPMCRSESFKWLIDYASGAVLLPY